MSEAEQSAEPAVLALTLHQEGRYLEACEAFQAALQKDPANAALFNQLGRTLEAMDQHTMALGAYRKALSLHPRNLDTLTSLGNLFIHLDQLEDAWACHQAALALSPGDFRVINNLGATCLASNRLVEALGYYEQACALAPGDAACRYNTALTHLSLGHFKQGWALLSSRFETDPNWLAMHEHAWDGSPARPPGRSLLLVAEQGLGDTLQFLRYLPFVASLGYQVSLLAPAAFERLLSDQPWLHSFHRPQEPRPLFDDYCPLMSLPQVLEAQLGERIPPAPYLSLSARLQAAALPPSLSTPRLRPRVGLVWSGNPRHRNNHKRSLPLSRLVEVLEGLPCDLYSLQKSPTETDAATLAATPWITDLGPGLKDLADTACCIQQMDIVVAVDTSVLHLAGALGKPALALLAWAADWRWQADRTDSPWYGSLTLLRQDAPRDWTRPLQAVRERLLAQR